MRVARIVGVAAVALALLAPRPAEANFHFSCGACNTVGGGPTVVSPYLYVFTATNPPGSYDFWASATATGTFLLTIYSAYDSNTGMGTTVYAGPQLYDATQANSNTKFWTVALNGTFYLGATKGATPCQQGQGGAAGCQLQVRMVAAGTDPGGGGDSTVPEPASMLLLASGLLALGARRRRKPQA